MDKPKRPVGRPRLHEERELRKNVMLDVTTIEKATAMGRGNLSAGLRRAVKVAARLIGA